MLFFGRPPSWMPPDIRRRALARIQRVVSAAALSDLRLPPSHRPEGLRGDRTGQRRLDKAVHTPARRINEIIHGRRSITTDTALRPGRALGVTPEFRMNLQSAYDLALARSAADVGGIERLAPDE